MSRHVFLALPVFDTNPAISVKANFGIAKVMPELKQAAHERDDDMTVTLQLKREVPLCLLPVSVETNFCAAKVTSEPKSPRLPREVNV
jgi:hypothetical protein